MKFLINKKITNIIPSTKIYNLGSIITNINDLLNLTILNIDQNTIPVLKIDDINYLINNFNPRNNKEDFEILLTESDLISFGSSGYIQSISGDLVDNTDPLNPLIIDAPSDGNQYVRQDGEWVEITSSGSLPIEITEDGNFIIKDELGNNVFIITENGELVFNTLSEFTLFKLKTDLGIQNKIRGLNVSILGDSISTTNGGGSGIAEPDTYGGLLRDLQSCNVYRNAVAGSNLSTDFTADARVNSLNSVNEPDVILVFGGVNDFLEDATLGSFGDTTTSTFYGGLDVLCIKLQTRYPNARIFFMTPLHHKYTTAGGLVPEYNGTNYMLEFVEAIEKVCKRYGISVINTNQDSGITCYSIDDLAPDLIHVNETGHQMIYNTIISETNLKL